MQTRQKRRILPDTMIQEIGRSVKCQKLNKFISRTPKLSVNKPNPLRGDQFPGDPRWLSGYAGTFYPLTVLSRRNLTPRQTRPLPGNARELLPAGAGDQFPGAPRWLSGYAGTFYPLTVLPRRNLTPRQTRPTPRDCQGTAPRRGAALKCGRNLRFPHKRPLPKRGAGVCDWLSLCSRVFS